jgi:F-type H+-transporting ATPase subunit delta
VIERTLAKRYAAALLRLTDPEGSTEEAESLLLALRSAWESDKGFRGMLLHPQIPRKAKKALLRKALEGRARPSFLDFLDLLVDKNRVNLLPELAEVFDRLADASKGVVRVKVESWKPLDEGRKAALGAALSRLTGKKVDVQAEADASLLGGLRVRVGDSVIDASVANRLKVLGEKFQELQRR